ncbi:MAG: peptide chain release factor N(5)-glutamine methyltransferase [Bradymonadales bacterium]|nr:peptide chain release factor N(5)-glutamine methyltransferase [Bradymonadales bacterium]
MSAERNTIAGLLEEAVEILQHSHIDSARRDAEVLLGHILQIDRSQLIAHPEAEVAEQPRAQFWEAIRRRGNREPVAYILGEKEFWSMTFRVNPQVLIPRPETECLVECSLKRIDPHRPQRILEIGTGSGAIICALARERPSCRCLATDISSAALDTAAENIRRHGLEQRIELRRGDLFDPIDRQERFDLIVSNPPYLASSEADDLVADVRDHEPSIALFSGPDGLEVIHRLLEEAPLFLFPGGHLLFECSPTQIKEIQADLGRSGCRTCAVHPDYAGLPRVVVARW